MIPGGNNYSAVDSPGGPLLGGTTYSMTVPSLNQLNYIPNLLSANSFARGNHIDVACRSVCDWNQNRIKRSTLFLGADQEI